MPAQALGVSIARLNDAVFRRFVARDESPAAMIALYDAVQAIIEKQHARHPERLALPVLERLAHLQIADLADQKFAITLLRHWCVREKQAA